MYGVHRARRDGSSFCGTSYVTTKQRCKYTTSVIFGERERQAGRQAGRGRHRHRQTDRERSTVIHLESHTRRARWDCWRAEKSAIQKRPTMEADGGSTHMLTLMTWHFLSLPVTLYPWHINAYSFQSLGTYSPEFDSPICIGVMAVIHGKPSLHFSPTLFSLASFQRCVFTNFAQRKYSSEIGMDA